MKARYMIGPIVVFAAVVLLLVAARVYDRLPIKGPVCQLKKHTGIPCLACRGTRSFQAIAKGQFLEAVKLNPGAVLGAIISALWLIGYLVRKGNPPKRTIPLAAIVWTVCLILACNWLYLNLTRHWYP